MHHPHTAPTAFGRIADELTQGFARFVASVPAPLCIGTLRLADGTRPKGFLVEPAGLEGAEDITRFGGWRAFLSAGA
jgi:allophanate hydrolase